MDKTKAAHIIAEAQKLVDSNPEVKLFLISKHNKNVTFNLAEIEGDIKQSFIDRWNNDYSDDNELAQYEIAMEKTDYNLFCLSKDYSDIDKYIDKISDPKQYVDSLEVVKKHLNWVKGYCAKIYDDNHCMYLFGSTGTFNSLKKKPGLLANVYNHKISKLDPETAMIGFYRGTTCFIYDKTCIIKSKKHFEDMFGLLGEYRTKALTVVKLFQNEKAFYQNLDTLVKDLDKRPVLYRSLAKIAKRPKTISRISHHLDKIIEIKKSPTFKEKYKDLEINDKGIVYSANALSQFLDLMNEKPVQSLITGDEFSAEREEE